MRQLLASTTLALLLGGCTFTALGPQAGPYAATPGNACGAVCGVPMGCRTAVHRMYHGGSGERPAQSGQTTSTRGSATSWGIRAPTP